jgi:hypothetical protein
MSWGGVLVRSTMADLWSLASLGNWQLLGWGASLGYR